MTSIVTPITILVASLSKHDWNVLDEEEKNGYASYKVQEKEIQTLSWHEKNTGLLIANEIHHGSESIITTLIRTNADVL